MMKLGFLPAIGLAMLLVVASPMMPVVEAATLQVDQVTLVPGNPFCDQSGDPSYQAYSSICTGDTSFTTQCMADHKPRYGYSAQRNECVAGSKCFQVSGITDKTHDGTTVRDVTCIWSGEGSGNMMTWEVDGSAQAGTVFCSQEATPTKMLDLVATFFMDGPDVDDVKGQETTVRKAYFQVGNVEQCTVFNSHMTSCLLDAGTTFSVCAESSGPGVPNIKGYAK